MYKIIFTLMIFLSLSFSEEADISLIHTGVEIDYANSSGEKKHLTVKREIDTQCKNIPITNEAFWKENYASRTIAKECKSTFITSAGKKIFPMKIHNEIETFGEVEVLTYIKKMQDNKNMLLIDTRDEEWYRYRTIPGAINIHYVYIMMPETFVEEYKSSLVKLGVQGDKKSFDFSQSKTILLFCNGAWCSQSPKMVKALLTLGYPPEKIKWYRGGMDDWLGLSMTTTRK